MKNNMKEQNKITKKTGKNIHTNALYIFFIHQCIFGIKLEKKIVTYVYKNNKNTFLQ